MHGNSKLTLRTLAILAVGITAVLGCQSTTPSPETTAAVHQQADMAAPTPVPAEFVSADDASAATEPDGEEPIEESPAAALLTDDDPVVVEPEADPAEIQQEALELCQSAAEFLDQGDMEDAIAALDRAYELMLSLPNNGDTTFLQAKEDIRVLAADLITRTYESRRTVAREPKTSWDLAIPIVDNEHVQREIKSFTTVERDQFIAGYRRSGSYRPMILAKLEEAGLPSQLSWMPLVESWFKARALSRARALGMWQFIHSTGLRYGLKRDTWVDERMDPERSTAGAIGYLSELHELFGDWPKALAAYNCGEARVMRLTNRQAGEYQDFWDLYALLPRETRRYVPRFIAALLIIESPEKYGMSLPELDPPIDGWEIARIDRSVKLDVLEKELSLADGTLRLLNPELRHGATPKAEYELKVPAGVVEALTASIEKVPEWSPPTPTYSTHRVRRGETLSVIARRYRTSVSAIMQSNRIRSANRIWPGQRLKIPVRGSVSTGTYNAAEGTHTVNRGESLYSIARRYKTTVAHLKRENGLSSNLIHPGQSLKVHPGSRAGLRKYQVQSGDTMGTIARAHGASLSALLRVNGLSSRSTIYPGQWLVIPD